MKNETTESFVQHCGILMAFDDVCSLKPDNSIIRNNFIKILLRQLRVLKMPVYHYIKRREFMYCTLYLNNL